MKTTCDCRAQKHLLGLKDGLKPVGCQRLWCDSCGRTGKRQRNVNHPKRGRQGTKEHSRFEKQNRSKGKGTAGDRQGGKLGGRLNGLVVGPDLAGGLGENDHSGKIWKLEGKYRESETWTNGGECNREY